MVIMHEKSKKSVDATRMAACTLCVVLVMLVGVDRAVEIFRWWIITTQRDMCWVWQSLAVMPIMGGYVE